MLKVKELNIIFQDRGKPETAVKQLSFDMREGERIGIVGESGSGKTMTALAIAGLLMRKDVKKQGEILWEGKNILSFHNKELCQYRGKEMGMIFQEPMTSLNPVKKIGWQMEESLRIHEKFTKKERYERAIAQLMEVGLLDAKKVYHQYPHELSGGMRQRVMIGAALICNPKLMIADEPTTALDVTVQDQILQLLKKRNKEKKTGILFISHDLELVQKLCERVIVMHKGMIVEKGLAREVFTSPSHEYTKKLIASIPKVERRKGDSKLG